MSSSSEPVAARVRRDAAATVVTQPELRSGTWTRLGEPNVLGDAVTEAALGPLAERVRATARAQGYAVGWAEGRRAAEEQAEGRAREAEAREYADQQRRESAHRAVLTRLDEAVERLEREVTATCEELADRSLALARELTALLVGHELRCSPDTGADALRRALALLPDTALATIRLNPADLASSEVSATAQARHLTVVADPALAPGDVVVDRPEDAIDGRIDAALARVAEALSDGEPR